MSTDANESPDTALNAPADDAAAAPVKRRTRTRKAATETASADSVAPTPPAAESAPAEAAPVKRTRAPRRKASPVGEEAAPVAPASIDTAPVAEPVTTGAERAMPASEAASEPPAAADDRADGETSTAPSSDDGEESEGRRGRNRRRGRRGSRRGEGADGERAGAAVEGVVPNASDLFASVVAGDFDGVGEAPVAAEAADDTAAEGTPEASAASEAADVTEAVDVADDKRVLAPDVDAPKLHKVLAQSGAGSRRDMEQAIEDGRVEVNGEKAHVGMRISFGDRITLDGKPIKVRIAPPPARVIAYHKPVGEVVTLDDPQQRPTVFRRLPRLQHGKWQSVGRLDINTEGLLLFTTSGDLANKLMHPRFGVEREYAVRVLGTLEAEARDKLLAGVDIEGQQACFKSVEDGGGEGVNHWYRVVISEGRNREVRKLFDTVGLTVSRLIRIRYGCVVLPRGLQRGAWVDLSQDDLKALRRLTDAPHAPREGGKAPARGPDKRPQAPRDEARGPKAKAAGGRRPREERGEFADDREPGDPSRIPNPLQQTFDRRHVQRERQGSREIDYENFIPNPLQQTYDKRFVQGDRGVTGGKRGGKGGGGGQGGQPDPMRTSVGYIGADAFAKKLQGRSGGGGGGGGGGGRRRRR